MTSMHKWFYEHAHNFGGHLNGHIDGQSGGQSAGQSVQVSVQVSDCDGQFDGHDDGPLKITDCPRTVPRTFGRTNRLSKHHIRPIHTQLAIYADQLSRTLPYSYFHTLTQVGTYPILTFVVCKTARDLRRPSSLFSTAEEASGIHAISRTLSELKPNLLA